MSDWGVLHGRFGRVGREGEQQEERQRASHEGAAESRCPDHEPSLALIATAAFRAQTMPPSIARSVSAEARSKVPFP